MTNNETLQPADGRGNVELDKATLRKVFFRWYFFSQANWNYEKMQGAGYCFSMFPVLKKVYGDDDEAMHAAVANHLVSWAPSQVSETRCSAWCSRRCAARSRHTRHLKALLSDALSTWRLVSR